MSVIFVFVGQCGNQVGAAVAKKLAENCAAAPPSRSTTSNSQQQHQHPLQQPTPYSGPFFGTDGYFRSVLVDCEPKVVDSVVKSCAEQNIFIRPTNLVTGRSGRGNSWSLGYCGLPETDEAEVQAGAFRVSTGKDQLERDRTVLCRALKAIHAETRRCDDGMVEAIVVLHSMAGGTGSGLGCALVENIRHHFCCNGNIHEACGGNGDNFDDDDFHQSGGGGFNQDNDDEVAQFFMRGGGATTTRNNNKKKQAKKQPPPPSILHEDMIREGTYGEPRKARYVLSVCVAPLVQGELAVQSINASLTLRTLIKNCDAVILLRNDCQKIFSASHQQQQASSSSKSKSSSSVASSFDSINQFFASLLVSALQGGTVFGCVDQLLESSVFRVAGDDLNWEDNDDGDHEDEDSYLHMSDDEEHAERISKLLKPNSSSKAPRFGPRILTVIPWEPRSAWTAAFRHSSVTATLVRPSSNNNSSSSTTGQQHDPQLLEAYLCNDVKGLESELCSIIDRDGTMNALLRQSMLQDNEKDNNNNKKNRKSSVENSSPGMSITKEDKKVFAVHSSSSSSASSMRNSSSIRPVLVLNQSTELTSSILQPFFKDAAAKVDTGAYMHAFNTRGILSQVFDPPVTGNNNARKSKFSYQPPSSARRVSPRRGNVDSEKRNTEFARQFVNNALVDLLEYITDTYPGM